MSGVIMKFIRSNPVSGHTLLEGGGGGEREERKSIYLVGLIRVKTHELVKSLQLVLINS